MEDIIVIIRAAGERTEKLCKKLVLEQGIAEESVKMIHEVPFSAALKKSYEIGIESGKKWTFCVDADVLLRPNSIVKLIELADKEPENVCEIQGYMMDKFFGGIRRGGVHLYRSSLLPIVLENIPEEGDDIRPETRTLKKMKELGYPRARVAYIVGLHDEEQFNLDIYRKAFVHGVKHINRIPLFVKLWKEKIDIDDDFRVALKGLSDSLVTFEELYINSKQPVYKEKFDSTGIEEKSDLDLAAYNGSVIEEIVQEWNYSKFYDAQYPDKDGYLLAQRSHLKTLQMLAEDKGFLYTVKLAVGSVLIKAGNVIKSSDQ